jgi:hypothetical protein
LKGNKQALATMPDEMRKAVESYKPGTSGAGVVVKKLKGQAGTVGLDPSVKKTLDAFQTMEVPQLSADELKNAKAVAEGRVKEAEATQAQTVDQEKKQGRYAEAKTLAGDVKTGEMGGIYGAFATGAKEVEADTERAASVAQQLQKPAAAWFKELVDMTKGTTDPEAVTIMMDGRKAMLEVERLRAAGLKTEEEQAAYVKQMGVVQASITGLEEKNKTAMAKRASAVREELDRARAVADVLEQAAASTTMSTKSWEFINKGLSAVSEQMKGFLTTLTNISQFVDNASEVQRFRKMGEVVEAGRSFFVSTGHAADVMEAEASAAISEIEARRKAIDIAQGMLSKVKGGGIQWQKVIDNMISGVVGQADIAANTGTPEVQKVLNDPKVKAGLASFGQLSDAYMSAAKAEMEAEKTGDQGAIAAAQDQVKTAFSGVQDAFNAAMKGAKEAGPAGEAIVNGLNSAMESLKLFGATGGSVEIAGLELDKKRAENLSREVAVWDKLSKLIEDAGKTAQSMALQQVASAAEAQLSLQAMSLDAESIGQAGAAWRAAVSKSYDEQIRQQESATEKMEATGKSRVDSAQRALDAAEQLPESEEKRKKIAEAVETLDMNRANLNRIMAAHAEKMAKLSAGRLQDTYKTIEAEAAANSHRVSQQQELVDIQKDLAQQIGAPFETIMALEQQTVDLKYQELAIAKDAYDQTVAEGIKGDQLMQAQIKFRKAEAAVATAAVGAQRSALEKMLGGFMSSFSNVGITTGPTRARRFGAGFTAQGGPGGWVVAHGQEGGEGVGYEERLGRASLRGAMGGARGRLGIPAQRMGEPGKVEAKRMPAPPVPGMEQPAAKPTVQEPVIGTSAPDRREANDEKDATVALTDELGKATDAIEMLNRLLSDGDARSMDDITKGLADGINEMMGRLPSDTEVAAKEATYAASGGVVASYYADGGSPVNFAPKGTDTVPAMLTPGEFVMPKEAVGYYGLDFMETLRGKKIDKPSYLASGGEVAASAISIGSNILARGPSVVPDTAAAAFGVVMDVATKHAVERVVKRAAAKDTPEAWLKAEKRINDIQQHSENGKLIMGTAGYAGSIALSMEGAAATTGLAAAAGTASTIGATAVGGYLLGDAIEKKFHPAEKALGKFAGGDPNLVLADVEEESVVGGKVKSKKAGYTDQDLRAGEVAEVILGAMHLATGGTTVDFEPKGTDTIPAMLTRGEYVIPAESVDKYGVDYMASLRDMTAEQPTYLAEGSQEGKRAPGAWTPNTPGEGVGRRSVASAGGSKLMVAALATNTDTMRKLNGSVNNLVAVMQRLSSMQGKATQATATATAATTEQTKTTEASVLSPKTEAVLSPKTDWVQETTKAAETAVQDKVPEYLAAPTETAAKGESIVPVTAPKTDWVQELVTAYRADSRKEQDRREAKRVQNAGTGGAAKEDKATTESRTRSAKATGYSAGRSSGHSLGGVGSLGGAKMDYKIPKKLGGPSSYNSRGHMSLGGGGGVPRKLEPSMGKRDQAGAVALDMSEPEIPEDRQYKPGKPTGGKKRKGKGKGKKGNAPGKARPERRDVAGVTDPEAVASAPVKWDKEFGVGVTPYGVIGKATKAPETYETMVGNEMVTYERSATGTKEVSRRPATEYAAAPEPAAYTPPAGNTYDWEASVKEHEAALPDAPASAPAAVVKKDEGQTVVPVPAPTAEQTTAANQRKRQQRLGVKEGATPAEAIAQINKKNRAARQQQLGVKAGDVVAGPTKTTAELVTIANKRRRQELAETTEPAVPAPAAPAPVVSTPLVNTSDWDAAVQEAGYPAPTAASTKAALPVAKPETYETMVGNEMVKYERTPEGDKLVGRRPATEYADASAPAAAEPVKADTYETMVGNEMVKYERTHEGDKLVGRRPATEYAAAPESKMPTYQKPSWLDELDVAPEAPKAPAQMAASEPAVGSDAWVEQTRKETVTRRKEMATQLRKQAEGSSQENVDATEKMIEHLMVSAGAEYQPPTAQTVAAEVKAPAAIAPAMPGIPPIQQTVLGAISRGGAVAGKAPAPAATAATVAAETKAPVLGSDWEAAVKEYEAAMPASTGPVPARPGIPSIGQVIANTIKRGGSGTAPAPAAAAVPTTPMPSIPGMPAVPGVGSGLTSVVGSVSMAFTSLVTVCDSLKASLQTVSDQAVAEGAIGATGAVPVSAVGPTMMNPVPDRAANLPMQAPAAPAAPAPAQSTPTARPQPQTITVKLDSGGLFREEVVTIIDDYMTQTAKVG